MAGEHETAKTLLWFHGLSFHVCLGWGHSFLKQGGIGEWDSAHLSFQSQEGVAVLIGDEIWRMIFVISFPLEEDFEILLHEVFCIPFWQFLDPNLAHAIIPLDF